MHSALVQDAQDVASVHDVDDAEVAQPLHDALTEDLKKVSKHICNIAEQLCRLKLTCNTDSPLKLALTYPVSVCVTCYVACE